MNEHVVFVIELGDPRGVESVRRYWQLDDLRKDLAAAGLGEVTLFDGKLEDAPEAWAYVLFPDLGTISERAKLPRVQERLKRSMGAEGSHRRAAALAESLDLLGALENETSSWFGPQRKRPKAENFLFIRRELAAALGWPLFELHGSEHFASTDAVPMPLPGMLIKYLRKALDGSK